MLCRLTLARLNARSNFCIRVSTAAGFNGQRHRLFCRTATRPITAQSAQFIRRFANGFQMTAAYTWSHLIDDTTAEVFSTVLEPASCSGVSGPERSSVPTRLWIVVIASWFRASTSCRGSATTRTSSCARCLADFNFTGTWTLESGEKATVLSGIDSNLNADAAADRTISNPQRRTLPAQSYPC